MALQSPTPDSSYLDLIVYWNIIVKQWKLLITICCVVTVGAVLYALLSPPVYTASASILPTRESSNLGQFRSLSGLMGNLGMSNPISERTSDLYPTMLKSESLLFPLLQTEFQEPAGEIRKILLDWLRIKDSNLQKRLYKGYNKLISSIDVRTDSRDGIIHVEVRDRCNWLAAQILNSLIKALDRYNRESRVSKAHDNRVFVEKQFNITQDSLRQAQEKLRDHRSRNRRIENSPELLMERERLEQETRVQSELYIELAKQYKLAQIEEFKDIPVVDILDNATIPQFRSKPARTLVVLSGFGLGLLLGAIVILIRSSVKLS